MPLSAYAQRYAGGFADNNAGKPVDAQYLNAVETALLGLLGANPTDGAVQVYDNALGRFKTILLTNAHIDPAAAIAKSKLAPLALTDADIAAGANISPSKLNLGTGSVAQALFGDAWAASARLLWDSVDAGVVLPAASITTPTLSSAFKHLLIAYEASSNQAAVSFLGIQINGDSAGHYYGQRLAISNAVATPATDSATTAAKLGLTGGTANLTYRGGGIILIPNYNASMAHPMVGLASAFSGSGAASQTLYILGAMKGDASAVVTTLTFLDSTGVNILAGSRISVYGLG